MRLLVFDFSGHPFQAQLSRELARRGHDVVHSWSAAYVSGRGHLAATAGDTVSYQPVSTGRSIAKTDYLRRSIQELRMGVDLVRHVRRVRPDVVLLSTTPVPMAVLLAAFLRLVKVPWVLWHQDVQADAVRRLAGTKISRLFAPAARLLELGERFSARAAAAIVVITSAFRSVHDSWGTSEKVEVIPNWAPLDEIVPVPRDNAWARRHGLVGVRTLLYSGTLGLKHDPALLPELARAVIDDGTPVRLVVVNEGPAVELVRQRAAELDVPLTLLPYQPYHELSQVLGSGDMLVVLLEKEAGEYSVPSKTLSYLAAGRPVLGLMPESNLAAGLVLEAGGYVASPVRESLPGAARWVGSVLADPVRAGHLGGESRQLAEKRFALEDSADRFEAILKQVAG